MPLVGASSEHKNVLKSRRSDTETQDRKQESGKIKTGKKYENEANIKLIPKRD